MIITAKTTMRSNDEIDELEPMEPEISRPEIAAPSVEVARQRLRSRFTVARLISEARRKRGWTQTDLAAQAKTTQARISEIEGIHGNPRFDTLERVTSALGLQISVIPWAEHDGCEYMETAATKLGRIYDRFSIISPRRTRFPASLKLERGDRWTKNPIVTESPIPFSRTRMG